MSHRIAYSVWGAATKLGLSDSYAMSDGVSPDIDRVVASLERRSGLACCAGPRDDGTALLHGRPVAYHYTIMLGSPCPGGGWTPRGQVWIALEVGS